MKSYLTIDEFDNKFWRNENNELHREDGPAIECSNGDKAYYIHDKLHREDGPAIEWSNGDKHYYIHDRKLTPEEFKNYKLKKRLKQLIKKT